MPRQICLAGGTEPIGRPACALVALYFLGFSDTGGGTMSRVITNRRQKTGVAITGASVIGGLVVGPRLMGPSAMAPVAIAASALGALAVGRVAVADAVIRKLRAGEIEIGTLKVRELEVSGHRWPGGLPPSTA
jgi:hypothetical protein